MEIVFLNTFNGILREPISEFISTRAGRTDIFCLQEVYEKRHNMRKLADTLLPGYHAFFSLKNTFEVDFSQATYVHPRLAVTRIKTVFPTEENLGLGIVTEVEYEGKRLSICNFHGTPEPGDKLDTPERLKQSRQMAEYFRQISTPQIIGGDFNLDINTESVRIFEKSGYRNLVKECAIRTTRNRIAWERFPQTPQLHSDYIFVSPDLPISCLEVPKNEISDHLPLILKI